MIVDNSMLVDLHLHSKFSDGELTPQQIIKFVEYYLNVYNQKKAIISITDHDSLENINSIQECMCNLSTNLDINVVIGTEFTTSREHILLYFDANTKSWNNSIIQNMIKKNQSYREDLFKTRIDLANKFSEIDGILNYKELIRAHSGIKGKPAIAKALVKYEITENLFDAYLLLKKLPKSKYPYTAEEVIETINSIGGVYSYVAHPKNFNLLNKYISLGLDGFELPKNPVKHLAYKAIAKKQGVPYLQNSDSHFQIKEGNGNKYEPLLGRIVNGKESEILTKQFKPLTISNNFNSQSTIY